MIARGTLVAALVGVEILVACAAALAVFGPGSSAPNDDLVVDRAPRVFSVGANPRLQVDVGYADLTIRADRTSQIAVGLGAGDSREMMQENGPIAAREDGDSVRIDATDLHPWSSGDDRMVFVDVPPGTRVDVVRAGDITASGLRAEASFRSTGRGLVTIDGYAAPSLHVESGGPVVLDRVGTGRLDAQSDDRIDGTALDVRSGSVKSGDRVALAFVPKADTLVDADADSGKIVLIEPMKGAPVKRGSDDDASSQTIRLGAGDGHLAVHADDGDITLSQGR